MSIELTPNTLKEIFQKNVCPALDYAVHEVEHCEEIAKWGKANFLWQITCQTEQGEQNFFVKQARSQIKRTDIPEDVKRAQFLDPARCFGEADFLTYLAGIWGDGVVPKPLYINRDEFFFVMTDVGKGSPLLAEEFAGGRARPDIAQFIGEKFGRLHQSTFGSDIDFCASDLWRELMRSFYKDFWMNVGIRKHVLAEAVEQFYDAATDDHTSVVWGDPVHRNIFAHPNGTATFVDFDHTFRFDPALDSGILLAHWMWMMLNPTDEQIRADARQAIASYWTAYKKAIEPLGTDEATRIHERMIKWAGIYLVSRVDGRSESYFKETPEWEQLIRETGVDLFEEQKSEVAEFLKTL